MNTVIVERMVIVVYTVTVNTMYSVYTELYIHTRDYYVGACNTK